MDNISSSVGQSQGKKTIKVSASSLRDQKSLLDLIREDKSLLTFFQLVKKYDLREKALECLSKRLAH